MARGPAASDAQVAQWIARRARNTRNTEEPRIESLRLRTIRAEVNATTQRRATEGRGRRGQPWYAACAGASATSVLFALLFPPKEVQKGILPVLLVLLSALLSSKRTYSHCARQTGGSRSDARKCEG